MKKAIWSHLAVAGLSMALAFFLAAKTIAGDKYEYNIEHLKQKIKKNKGETDADIVVEQENLPEPAKTKRQLKGEKRKKKKA